MWKKLKNNNKKGFTLVELIVVLVILAILAALLIPALTGYIDKAKQKDIIAQTRQAVMATQTLVDEAYGKKTDGTPVSIGAGKDVTFDQIKGLAEIKGTLLEVTLTEAADTGYTINTVKKLIYEFGGKTCTYDITSTGDKYTVN